MKTIDKGVYQHYKGKHYRVISVANHSEDNSRLVVYKKMYGDHATIVQPYAMFTDTVRHENKMVPRFSYCDQNNMKETEGVTIQDLLDLDGYRYKIVDGCIDHTFCLNSKSRFYTNSIDARKGYNKLFEKYKKHKDFVRKRKSENEAEFKYKKGDWFLTIEFVDMLEHPLELGV